MKVSKAQKAETRRRIVRAAAELFVNQGFDKTSMKQIAKAAEIGDATVYKYFPNKDKLVLGFYEVCAEDALAEYRGTDELESYSFSERMQLLVDTLIEQLICDREFVALSVKQMLKSPVSLFRDELKPAKAYKEEFAEMLAALEEDERYPVLPMKSLIAGLLTDYLMVITFYWIKDDSEEFANTTQLCDLSISLIDSVLMSGMINKAMDTFSFFVKHHLLRGMSQGGNLLSMLSELNGSIKSSLKEA